MTIPTGTTPTGPTTTAEPTPQSAHYYTIDNPINYNSGYSMIEGTGWNQCGEDLFVGMGLIGTLLPRENNWTHEEYLDTSIDPAGVWKGDSDWWDVGELPNLVAYEYKSTSDGGNLRNATKFNATAPDNHDLNAIKERHLALQFNATGNTAYYDTDVKGYVICYGTHEPPPPPPPTYGVCNNTGIWKTIDVIASGSRTDGSLTAININPGDPNNGIYATDKISFEYTLDLPGPLMDGFKEGWVGIDLGGNYGPNFPSDANPGLGSHLDWKINIAGSEFTIKDATGTDPASFNDTNKIALTGGLTHLVIHYEATYANQFTNRVNFYPITVLHLRLKVLLGNACAFNILNDGGMEWYPDSPYWGLSTAGNNFGRRNTRSIWDGMTQGYPACGQGWQTVTNSDGAIEEPFTWTGGNAYWKIKYKSGLGIFFGNDVPSVYLSDESGAIIDLVGTGHWDPALVSKNEYAYMTGGLYLSGGNYKIHLDKGCDYNGINQCGSFDGVLFDDISLGSIPPDNTCDEIIYTWPDNEPTPTPTPTAPTPTGTRMTGTTTLMASQEATGTRTGTVTATFVKTPLPETSTPRSTATIISTPTPYTHTPTKSSTPWGNGSSQTPNPHQQTATAQGTPRNNDDTPDPNMPPIININGTPIPGMDPLQPGPDVICIRPAAWYDIAWWMDYERCVLMAFVAFGPSQIATVQAIPTIFASKEPFNTVGQARNAIQGMKTEVSAMEWANTGMNGVSAPVTADDPVHIFKPLAGGNDPWSGIGKFTINLGSRNPVLTQYCSNQLSGFFSKYLGEGMCYVLNLMMAIGYLPWIQFLINLLCVWGIIKQGLGVIGYVGGSRMDNLTDTVSRSWKNSK